MADFIFADKPSGFNSHQSHPARIGFVEFLEKKMNRKLFLVSRLDQGTSGAMVFPTSPASAKKMTELFEEKRVQKSYLFLTDKKAKLQQFVATSLIEKSKSTFVSIKGDKINSETEFQFLRSLGPYFLWRARPKTGKTHQIRLHAEDFGISILGDREHGGTEFYRLCLHCESLGFVWNGEKVSYSSPPPVWSEFNDNLHWIFQEAQQKRKFLLENALSDRDCYRLMHTESEVYQLDIFGPQAWLYRYKQSEISEPEDQFFKFLTGELKKPILIKTMVNRGAAPGAGDMKTYGDFKPSWLGEEIGVKYEFRSTTGQSPGLFLDQRENRLWLRHQAQGKTILNLFCYTGGFSVVAALAAAQSTTSVDVSGNFLEWTKRNFEINGLNREGHEFWESDVLFFLRAALKRNRRWDLIICDPPSFGRSKEGVFKIEDDWSKLLRACTEVLSPQGQILFSTNFEKWTFAETQRMLESAPGLKNFSVLPAAGPGWDFELSEEPVLKSFILTHLK